MKEKGKKWIWRLLLIVFGILLLIWLFRLCAAEWKEPRLTEDYLKYKMLEKKGK